MQAQQILQERQAELTRKRNENALMQRQLEALEQKIIGLAEKATLAQDALDFLEDLANSRRGAMKGKIENIVTEAMHLIYDDSYSAELTYTVKANRSHLDIEMVRQTKKGEVRRDMGGFGGGMADTMSVPMRLMVLMGAHQTDKVCVLDECWKHIDPERVELVGKFVRVLADKLGIQTVFLTHHPLMRDYADRVCEITEDQGKSKVEMF